MFDLYRSTMADTGFADAMKSRRLHQTAGYGSTAWLRRRTPRLRRWRALPTRDSLKHITGGRERMNTKEEQAEVEAIYAGSDAGPEDDLVYGAPDTVSETVAALRDAGAGGIMIQFRIGDMPWEDDGEQHAPFRQRSDAAIFVESANDLNGIRGANIILLILT